MTTIRPLFGSNANWMLHPPANVPIERIALIAASRICWNCLSVSVCCGAIVTESPVWTPIGSRFSMEQMMMTFSALSRSSSSSYSFHPKRHSSMRTSWTGESSSPRVTFRSNSSGVQTMPPPAPPIVKLGRMTMGWKPSPPPSSCAISLASRSDFATRLRAWSIPMDSMRSRKRWRSSVIRIASMSTPMTSIPFFFQ